MLPWGHLHMIKHVESSSEHLHTFASFRHSFNSQSIIGCPGVRTLGLSSTIVENGCLIRVMLFMFMCDGSNFWVTVGCPATSPQRSLKYMFRPFRTMDHQIWWAEPKNLIARMARIIFFDEALLLEYPASCCNRRYSRPCSERWQIVNRLHLRRRNTSVFDLFHMMIPKIWFLQWLSNS